MAAISQVQSSVSRIEAIDPDGLLKAVAPLAELRAQVGTVALTTATAARAVRLLLPMLGAVGPREYLLLVQNNAAQRGAGGIPGSVVLLRAEGGAVKAVEQRGQDRGGLARSVLPLTADEQALLDKDLGAEMLDVTFTPGFRERRIWPARAHRGWWRTFQRLLVHAQHHRLLRRVR